jgi:epsin
VKEVNWIQALVLLEFLVKNGSERVVDDARSHIATVKILRNFHYIDEKAKDQGINGIHHSDPKLIVVRNRAKELAELLSDSEKIRTERRKAKQSKTKYTGVGSDEAGFGGSGKKYGGFGSEDLSYGSYSGQVYGIFIQV